MFHQLHKKLTLLYTLTTGLILTIVLIVLLLYGEKLLLANSREEFQMNTLTLVNHLQSNHLISHSWLAQMEAENNLIIHIEENGTPLLYRGSWTPDTDRGSLIQKAKNLAAKYNIDTSITPVSSGVQQSELFQLRGSSRDLYQGIVIKLPNPSGYRSLVLLQSLQPVRRTVMRQRLLFALLELLGILALFLVSWNFVKKSLRPLKENKEKQDAFFAAASHELRSPIAVIQASANAIPANSAQADRLCANILSECKRLSRLIRDMLTLASSDSFGWSMHPEPIDMDTLLLNVYELFENLCIEKKIPLSLSLPEESLPTVMGDRERLLQILTILLDNAVSYSEKGGICIHAHAVHRFVCIKIIDHGIGIPDTVKPYIFDHFYRADHARGDKSHFGLGLGIALELTRLHKGRLTVSDTEGGGSTFQLLLPCSL